MERAIFAGGCFWCTEAYFLELEGVMDINPGYIGGHCVIPNLDLLHNQTLELIKKINTKYSKKIRNSKNIYKKCFF